MQLFESGEYISWLIFFLFFAFYTHSLLRYGPAETFSPLRRAFSHWKSLIPSGINTYFIPCQKEKESTYVYSVQGNKYDTTLLSLKFKYLVMRGRFVPVLFEQVKWCRDGVGCVNVNRCFVSYIFLITLSDGTIHPARQDKNTFYQLLLAKSVIPMSRCWLQISAIYKLLVGQWAISCEVSS